MPRNAHARSGTERPAPPRASHGIATVLILLLVGLSLTAAVLGTASYIRGQQTQDVAVHAQTQAQMKAWTGAELVRQYLQQLQAGGQLTALYAKAAPFDLTLSGEGVTGAVLARITALDSATGAITARITGVTAPDSLAEARSVLEVVYAAGMGSGTAPSQCGAPVRASTVFRGDVTITGAGASFESNGRYADVAIDGSLTVGGGGAFISGCTKGDITLGGGGIDANATLSSQNGTLSMGSISAPQNATLWAKAIAITGTSNSVYNEIKAGAYQSNVVAADSTVVGTARAGGRLLDATAGPSVPWTTGTVKPWSTGTLLVALADGGEYLVDMSQVTIDAATGAVSGARAAAQKVNDTGSAELPDSFTLHATGLFGGSIDSSVPPTSVNRLWGYGVTLTGWGGSYKEMWPAGHLKMNTGAITDLLGGGELWVTSYDRPSFVNTGAIAGGYFHQAARTPISDPKIQAHKIGTSPGLPGAPFCDTRTETFDAAAFRSTANFIFEFDASGKPQLTIQHMKASNGTSIDRASIDLAAVDPAPATAQSAMTLRRINGVDFLGCNNQSPGNQYVDALACLRSATPANGWRLNGITKFPPGIALFIGPVTIDGVKDNQTLHNTLLSTGGVTLTSNAQTLVAPNFASPLAPVCDGPFYPANLCDKTTTPSTLAKWTDAEGQEHAGLPLANLAVGTNQNFSGAGWNLTGNVIVGGALDTSGGTVNIAGSVTVGANQPSATTIGAGGMRVDTTHLTGDQGYLPSGNCTPTAAPQPIVMKWSRYL